MKNRKKNLKNHSEFDFFRVHHVLDVDCEDVCAVLDQKNAFLNIFLRFCDFQKVCRDIPYIDIFL